MLFANPQQANENPLCSPSFLILAVRAGIAVASGAECKSITDVETGQKSATYPRSNRAPFVCVGMIPTAYIVIRSLACC